MNFSERLEAIEAAGNMRQIPGVDAACRYDFSTNDYLGINEDEALRDEFRHAMAAHGYSMSMAASRLLGADQSCHNSLEALLTALYGRECLLFNSGYHANTGIISALADKHTLILADKLVHASIIDGILLSRATFTRFAHNDFDKLEQLVAEADDKYDTILVIVESVYSMDGDRCDIDRLTEIRRRYPRVMLYVDEAHAFGVLGDRGLGLCAPHPEVDIIIGTLGKAAASMGAFAVTGDTLRRYLINTARSFIFSTALPPAQAAWSELVIRHITGMDDRRERLASLARRLHDGLHAETAPSHIVPYIVGDARRVVEMSRQMLDRYGVKVLPIRRPTVAAGTERLRISLSAAQSDEAIDTLIASIRAMNSAINKPKHTQQ